MTLYRAESKMNVVFGIVGAFVLVLLSGIVMKPAGGPEPLFFIAAAFLLGPALIRLTTSAATIEIDSTRGVVSKVTGPLRWKKRRSYPLRGIETVRLIEKDVIVEEGYGVTSYTIVIEYGGASHELFSTDDEAQGRTLYRELVSATYSSQKLSE
jgi:hypothetical protein